MVTADLIKEMAAQHGFDACLMIPGEWADDCPTGVNTLVLLLKRYRGQLLTEKEAAYIHPYYFASQQAYVGTKQIVNQLREMGETAIQDPKLRLIPLCSHIDCFKLGRNSLLYYGDWGSRFHIQVIGLQNKLQCDQSLHRIESVSDPCGDCTRCQSACPTHAITCDGVDGALCLREHMLSGKGTPEAYRHLMMNRLIGCDNCQAACPMNDKPSAPGELGCIALDDLLPPCWEFLADLADQIGSNLAIGNRICAQACLVAGNSQSLVYREKLHDLASHPSPAVSQSAQWALKRMVETDK